MRQPPRAHIWTVKELAKYLAVSETTIYSLLDEGRFPGAFRVRTQWRVPDSGVAQFIKDSMQTPETGKKKDHDR